MRPTPTRPSDDAGAADQAPTAGQQPVGEDAPTTKIDAPPPTGPAEQPRDATVVGQPTQPAPAPAPVVADPLAAASAGLGQRGKLRRRLRRLRNVRADQLEKLGTLVLDARKRSNGSTPEVVTRRAAEVAEINRQVRELGHAVDPHADRRAIVSGVAGSCRECGALLSTEDRFCANCGTATSAKRARPAGPEAAPTPAASGGVAEIGTSGTQIGHSPENSAPAPPPTPGTAQAPAAPPPTPGTAQAPTPPPPSPSQ